MIRADSRRGALADFLVLQVIICKRDVIITEYQELFVGRRQIKTEIVHIVNNNS